ncbi:hypothetical protein DPMN_145440 [Dreissena polymorpha]|uniref:Fibrinogen C-terminal domain-containing protein n=1 Tax=Dreissena polymorpha TaxID=45954 RepID=A0A9D4F409_DREPO|nr:hypothetical protein DPMN_145440 [Dreissena polymorpha]
MLPLINKMLLYMLILVCIETVSSNIVSESSTSRILRRLDKLEDDVSMIQNDIIEDLRGELSNLRKDLKEEIKLRREDISTLSNILTESSRQVVIHKNMEDSKSQHWSCDCGAILSKYDSVVKAFKREKSENIMFRKAFNEMRKQHDDFDSRLNSAERNLRSEIDTIKNETIAGINATQKRVNDIQKDMNAFFGLFHLNESLTNRSLNALQNISLITSNTANLSTSNEILKNVSDDIIRRQSKYISSCDGVAVSGEYVINHTSYQYGMKVYCDVDSKNKGWLVIQRRMNGSEDFNRSWADYKAGFGNVKGDFWLGNEFIYQLTKEKPRELRIDIEAFDGLKRYALYSAFSILSESRKYNLYVAGYNGDAGDSLERDHNNHNNQPFSTFDVDNDRSSTTCCACKYEGGWWYRSCLNVNLNGKYFKESETVPYKQGIHWYTFTGSTTSLKYVQMSIN